MAHRLAIFLLSAIALASSCAARAHESDRPVTVNQEIRIGAKPLKYVAETGRIAIRDTESGEPHGFMFYTAYRVKSAKLRPLTFLWNGGPGSSSTLLHFEAFGPKRLEDGALVHNAETLLTDSDLVFVDPIGSGFSRPAKAEYADEFYGTLGDIASVTEFVRAWRLLHDAADAPVFLIGESWGAGRAGATGYALEKRGVRVSGLVLVSGGTGLQPNAPEELVEALRIPNLSAVALFHGKVSPPAGSTPDDFRRTAEAWARDTYAPALGNVASLPSDERGAIVAGLARFTGFPGEKIDRKTLRVTPRQFREELLRAEGKTLDIFDMRRVAGDGGGSPNELLENYIRRDLGYRTDLPYLGLSGGFDQGYAPGGEPPQSVNARWDYFTISMSKEEKDAAFVEAVRVGGGPPRGGPPPPSTGEAVRLNPRMRVLIASGLYDSLANCAGSEEVEARLEGELREALQFECYIGGHMMYRDAKSRQKFRTDILRLMEQSTAASP